MIDIIIFGYRIRLERFRTMKLAPLPTNICAMTGAVQTREIGGSTGGRVIHSPAPLLPPKLMCRTFRVKANLDQDIGGERHYIGTKNPADMRHLTMPSGGPQ